jgi:signal transduction histidine kinase
MLVVRDTTERKRAKEALRESERQLQHLVRKLLVAQVEERREVAYEIHDGPSQVAISTHQHPSAPTSLR